MTSEYIYYSENNLGKVFCHYDREETFNWYERNNGTKIWTKTKDLFPTITVIVDKPNVDIRNIRKDDILSITSVKKREYISKYDKEHTKQVKLKLNLRTDKDILDELDNIGIGNKQTFIKNAIREYMKKQQTY